MKTVIAWPSGKSAQLVSVSYDRAGQHEVWELKAKQTIEEFWEKFVFPDFDIPPDGAA